MNSSIIRHLKVWQKLFLAAVLLLVPFGISLRYTDVQNFHNIVDPAQREILGTAALQPIETLLVTLQQQRVLSAAAPASDSPGGKDLVQTQSDIAGLLMQVGSWPPGLSSQTLQSKVEAARDGVNTLQQSVGTARYEDRVQQNARVTTQLLDLTATVGDESALTVDPDIATHYIMDAFLVQLPEVAQDVGRSSEILEHWALSKKDLDPAERDELQQLSSVINHSLAVQAADIPRFLAADLDTRSLESPSSEATAAGREFVAFVQQSIQQKQVKSEEVLATSRKTLSALSNWLGTLGPVEQDLLRKRIALNQKQTNRGYMFAALGILLFGLLGFVVARDITGPLLSILHVANSVAAGKVGVDVEETDRRDEFGNLNRAVHTMVLNLRKMLHSIDQVVGALTPATAAIRQTAGDLAQAAGEVSSSINGATTTVQELRVSSQQSVSRVQQVAQTAQQAADVSRSGRQATDLTLEEMGRIKDQVEQIADSILTLRDQTEAISEIITAVNDLAEQSNLLAVNASIEAATAGVHGRGFAVVAQQVRHLAEQSKQSTRQVRALLNEIQRAINTAVMVAEMGTKAVDVGVRQSQEAGESIKTLATRVIESAQAAAHISISIQQQQAGMDQVVTLMSGIQRSSLHTADSTRTMQSAAQQVYDKGLQLKQLTDGYSL